MAVGQKNIELGVFEIVGHSNVPVPAGTSNKVRFDLVPSEETLTKPLDDLHIFSSVRKYAFDYLSGDPRRARRASGPAAARGGGEARGPAAGADPSWSGRSKTCPICLLDVEDCLGH